jgi:hypothetical protein
MCFRWNEGEEDEEEFGKTRQHRQPENKRRAARIGQESIEPALPAEEGTPVNKNSGNTPSPWKDQLRRIEPHCPACLGDRAKICGGEVEGLCDECAKAFIDETGTALAEGKLVTIRDWMVSRLTTLEQKFNYAKAEFEDAQAGSVKEAAEFIDKTIGSAQVLPEVRKKAFQQRKQKLWLEKHGDTKFAIMKGLEDRALQLKTAAANSVEPVALPAPAPTAEAPAEPAAASTALSTVVVSS